MGGKAHPWIALGKNLEIFPKKTFMNSTSVPWLRYLPSRCMPQMYNCTSRVVVNYVKDTLLKDTLAWNFFVSTNLAKRTHLNSWLTTLKCLTLSLEFVEIYSFCVFPVRYWHAHFHSENSHNMFNFIPHFPWICTVQICSNINILSLFCKNTVSLCLFSGFEHSYFAIWRRRPPNSRKFFFDNLEYSM
jgi:hypothetical protein